MADRKSDSRLDRIAEALGLIVVFVLSVWLLGFAAPWILTHAPVWVIVLIGVFWAVILLAALGFGRSAAFGDRQADRALADRRADDDWVWPTYRDERGAEVHTADSWDDER